MFDSIIDRLVSHLQTTHGLEQVHHYYQHHLSSEFPFPELMLLNMRLNLLRFIVAIKLNHLNDVLVRLVKATVIIIDHRNHGFVSLDQLVIVMDVC